MGIRLSPRIQQLRRGQSHRKKFLMKCAECILNEGGRASEKFFALQQGRKATHMRKRKFEAS